MIEGRQGDTMDLAIPVKDKNGDPIDLSTLLGYAVFLYDSNGKLIKNYSKNALTGFVNTLTPSSQGVNYIRLICEASHTRQMKGEIFRVVKLQATALDYENGRWSGSSQREKLMTIKEDESSQYTTI